VPTGRLTDDQLLENANWVCSPPHATARNLNDRWRMLAHPRREYPFPRDILRNVSEIFRFDNSHIDRDPLTRKVTLLESFFRSRTLEINSFPMPQRRTAARKFISAPFAPYPTWIALSGWISVSCQRWPPTQSGSRPDRDDRISAL